MSEKPPLTRTEAYDFIHELWLKAAAVHGADEFTDNTLKAVRLSLFVLTACMVEKIDAEATDQTPVSPSSHSD